MKDITKTELEELEKEFYSRDHFPRTNKLLEEQLDAVLRIVKKLNLLS